MTLRESRVILGVWRYALENGADIVLMRHGPKSGSDESDLSTEGRKLAAEYGKMLQPIWSRFLQNSVLACTTKVRTVKTLTLLFPESQAREYLRLPELDAPRIPPTLQTRVEEFHRRVGRWRGYFLNHTYYFLERIGGASQRKHLHAAVAPRMARGIAALSSLKRPVIYCGHSPSIEVTCERLFGMEIAELGGFLNPLDSLHLRQRKGRIEFVARVNPVIGYLDLESETYLRTI